MISGIIKLYPYISNCYGGGEGVGRFAFQKFYLRLGAFQSRGFGGILVYAKNSEPVKVHSVDISPLRIKICTVWMLGFKGNFWTAHDRLILHTAIHNIERFFTRGMSDFVLQNSQARIHKPRVICRMALTRSRPVRRIYSSSQFFFARGEISEILDAIFNVRTVVIFFRKVST